MKYLKILGLAAVAAMALMAIASTASATTLEIKGVAQNSSVELVSSLEKGTTATLQTTDKSTLVDTCTGSEVKGKTEGTFTGNVIGGKVSSLTFTGCSHTTDVINPGKLTVSHIAGTTNGTVTSDEAEVTVTSTTFGASLVCATGAGVDIGTLTGVKEGSATMDIKGVINCGFFIPSALWEGSYTVTTPNIGVTS